MKMIEFGVYCYSKPNYHSMLFFSTTTQYCLAAVDKMDLLLTASSRYRLG